MFSYLLFKLGLKKPAALSSVLLFDKIHSMVEEKGEGNAAEKQYIEYQVLLFVELLCYAVYGMPMMHTEYSVKDEKIVEKYFQKVYNNKMKVPKVDFAKIKIYAFNQKVTHHVFKTVEYAVENKIIYLNSKFFTNVYGQLPEEIDWEFKKKIISDKIGKYFMDLIEKVRKDSESF